MKSTIKYANKAAAYIQPLVLLSVNGHRETSPITIFL